MQIPPKPAVTYRGEQPGDEAAIARLLTAAFGRDDETRLVDRLRAGGHARHSWVAEAERTIVGHVLYSELTIASPESTAAALALRRWPWLRACSAWASARS